MSEANHFDIIVIGSGPGGYIAAQRAGELGFKTALVEKSKALGGTCLNVGCIPSKALLHSTELYHAAGHLAESNGIELTNLSFNLSKMMKKKDDVVAKLNGGVSLLMKGAKVKVFTGHGSFAGDGKVRVEGGKEEALLKGTHIIIATGSSTVQLPFMPNDGKVVVGSDEAIAFDRVPGKLVVVGAGAIGLELGSVWARLGSEVDVIERLPQVAAGFDKDVSKLAERLFKKQGLRFHLGTKVTGKREEKGKHLLTAEKDGENLEFEADKILVAVGRKPNTDGLHLDAVGLSTNERGQIEVDSHFRTGADGIYAIGDVIPGPMLAHKAEEEGVACVELIAGQAGHVNYEVIPNVIYTDPEIASVGMTQARAKEAGIEVKVGKFSFAANGRALATDASDGLAKVIADAETDRLLGVQIIGKSASELIAAAVTHMEYGGSAEDYARTVHAHPTLSEAVKSAATAAR